MKKNNLKRSKIDPEN